MGWNLLADDHSFITIHPRKKNWFSKENTELIYD
jgi:hypothetical protein